MSRDVSTPLDDIHSYALTSPLLPLQRERIKVRDCFRAFSRTEWEVTMATCPHTARGPSPSRTAQEKRREQGTQATQSSLRLALCSLPLFRAGVATLPNFVIAQGTPLPRHPKIKEITNSTRNITNRSFAMPADAAAIPPNPKTAATSAIIRNITAQPNISSPPQRLNRICRLPRASLQWN
jgi:hypothetical protein